MLDRDDLLEKDPQGIHQALLNLAHSYAGPQTPLEPPYHVVAYGEAELGAALCAEWLEENVGKSGTQFLLSSGLDFGDAEEVADIAEARGLDLRRVGLTRTLEGLNFMVPRSALSPYVYAQYLAHATGHGSAAQEADAALERLAEQCQAHIPTEDNPAKKLAWALWTRTPLLLASSENTALAWGWQSLLARVGKSLSIALERSPLLLLSGGFEARHESGDERVALLLGEVSPELALAREILETRVDEVLEVTAPEGLSDYAARMYLWGLGAWVSLYVALSYGQDPGDSKALEALYAQEGVKPDDLELN